MITMTVMPAMALRAVIVPRMAAVRLRVTRRIIVVVVATVSGIEVVIGRHHQCLHAAERPSRWRCNTLPPYT